MKAFFRSFLASSLALITVGVVVVLIFAAIIGGTIASAFSDFNIDGGNSKTKITEKTILEFTFDKQIIDRKPGGKKLSAFLNGKNYLGLNDIIENIRLAKTDDRIKGILIDAMTIPAGWASIEEIRTALIDFKTSGKFIVSYSELYSHSSYYMSSVADEMYIYPQGEMAFQGFNSEIMFLKGLLDKLDVKMQIIRGSNNRFKSAVEPLIYDHMSDDNRLQTKKILGTMWNHMVKGISETRGVSIEELNLLADSISIQSAEDAVNHKLMDGIKYKDEIMALLNEKLGLDSSETVNLVKFSKYMSSSSFAKKKGLEKSKIKPQNEIAVIYCVGDINSGEGDDLSIGSDRIAEAIRDARTDKKIKAIVLRVNSPGGSALASDVIWREVKLAKDAKPVIVSMGDVAASGGYYISCVADEIFAEPNTITGSIGVFGIIPNLQGFWNNKLGITYDQVGTNANSGFGSLNRPLTDAEFNMIQKGVDRIYGTFKQRVADGRGMTVTEVDSIGQGRVWSGADAIGIGLVDKLGNLDDAIAEAAKMAELELDEFKIINLPKHEKNPLMDILEKMDEMDARASVMEEFGITKEMSSYFSYINSVKEMQGYQARMPYFITIK